MPRFSTRHVATALLLANALSCCAAHSASVEEVRVSDDVIYFNSPLSLTVCTAHSFNFTPVDFGPGIRVPAGSEWHVSVPHDEPLLSDVAAFAQQFAADIRQHAVPAIDFSFSPQAAAAVLVKLEGAPAITSVRFSAVYSPNEFALLAKLPQLTAFNGCVPTNECAKLLATLPKLKEIDIRSPDNHGFTDEQLAILASAKGLEAVHLNNCEHISAKSLPVLAELSRLRVLSLYNTGISISDLLSSPELPKFAGLAELIIGDKKTSWSEYEPLRRALPQVSIQGKLPYIQVSSGRLTAAERAEANRLIQQLGHKDFEQRESAQQGLLRLGICTQDILADTVSGAEAAKDFEVRKAAQAILKRLPAYAAERLSRETLAELARAVAESPQRYVPPDPQALARLSVKVPIDFNGAKMDEIISFFQEVTGVPFVIDPAIESNVMTSIRSDDADIDRHLYWMMKLWQTAYTLRGKVVVISTPERIRALTARPRLLKLPVAADEAPWTQEETAQALNVLMERPGNWAGYLPDASNAKLEPGSITLAVSDTEALQQFLRDFQQAFKPGTNLLPAWHGELERRLDEKITFDFGGKPAVSFAQHIIDSHGLLLVKPYNDSGMMVKSPEGPESMQRKLPADFAATDITLRQAIFVFSAHVSLRVFPTGRAVTATGQSLKLSPCFVDAREVLNTGVAAEKLREALRTILSPHGGACAQHPLRGRWLLYTDVWAAQIISDLLAKVARTGKIPEELPEPAWFAHTLRR